MPSTEQLADTTTPMNAPLLRPAIFSSPLPPFELDCDEGELDVPDEGEVCLGGVDVGRDGAANLCQKSLFNLAIKCEECAPAVDAPGASALVGKGWSAPSGLYALPSACLQYP